MGTSYNPKIVTDGLVLCLDAANPKSYPGSGTTWSDLSGNANNGTLTNGPTFNGANEGSFVFDGTNDYITLGTNKFKYQDNFTVETIAKFTSLPTNTGSACSARHPIVYNHDYGYNMLVNSTGNLNFQIYNTNSNNVSLSSMALVIGSKYFHAVGIKNGTNVSLFLNGIFINSGVLSTNAVYYINEPFVIGGFAKCGPDRFYSTGNISLVKIYNRALTAQEISQNFNATRGRYGI